MKKLCLGIAFLAVVACGGGGGGSSDDPTPPASKATVTVGSTVVKAGEAATIHAAVGDTLNIVASEVVPALNFSHPDGKTCSLQFPNGIHTNVDTYAVKIGTGTDECVLKLSFEAGDVTLTVLVP